MDKTFIKVMQECGISIIDDVEYRAEYQKMIDEAVRIHTEYSYSKETAIAVAIYYQRAKSKIQEKLSDSEFIIEETSIDKQLLSFLDTEQKNILLNAVQEYYKQLVNEMRHFFEDEGVIINGVKWATRNIDAPCVFSPTPESSGMFYQWNRKLGWAITDQLFNSNGGYTDSWDDTIPIAVEYKNYTQIVHNLFCSFLRANSASLYGVASKECPVIIQTLITYLFNPYNNEENVYKAYHSDLSFSVLKNCNFRLKGQKGG